MSQVYRKAKLECAGFKLTINRDLVFSPGPDSRNHPVFIT